MDIYIYKDMDMMDIMHVLSYYRYINYHNIMYIYVIGSQKISSSILDLSGKKKISDTYLEMTI